MKTLPTVSQVSSVAKTDTDFLEIAHSISQYVKRELETATAFPDVKQAHAMNGALEGFIKKAIRDRELKLKAANELAESRLEIERWMGRWLADLPRGNRWRNEVSEKSESMSHDATLIPTFQKVLKENELTRQTASRYEQAASLPAPIYRSYIEDTKRAGLEITTAAVLNIVKQRKAEQTRGQRQDEGQAAIREANRILPKTDHEDCIYNDGLIQTWIGDATKLHFIEDDMVDLIVTSPPYNIGQKSGNGRVLWRGVEYDTSQDAMPEVEYQGWQVKALDELWRVTRPGGSLFYNHKIRNRNGQGVHPMVWIAKSKWTFRQQIVWDRGSTHNKEMSYFWPHDELIFWMTKGTEGVYLSPEGARMSTVWQMGFKTNTDHPAPFPKTIPARCIRAASREGDIVLDPFVGSLTTCLAAKQLGRRSIGVDISEAYIKKYSVRLYQEVLL
jgi:modification methylase